MMRSRDVDSVLLHYPCYIVQSSYAYQLHPSMQFSLNVNEVKC